MAAALLLTACGGDDESGDEGTTSSEETAAEETPAEDPTDDAADEEDDAAGGDGGDVADLQAALLTTEDLPAGVEVSPFDVSMFSSSAEGMAELMEDVQFEPAECQDNSADPLQRDGVEAAAITALAELDALTNAVYSGATADDLAGLEDYYQNCGEIAVTGSISGQELDMTVTTVVAEGPAVDADAVLALDNVTEGAGLPSSTTRVIYMIDGDYGVIVGANPESATFDLEALAGTALERLRAAQG